MHGTLKKSLPNYKDLRSSDNMQTPKKTNNSFLFSLYLAFSNMDMQRKPELYLTSPSIPSNVSPPIIETKKFAD